MASGCILEICIVCDEFVWEDEEYMFLDDIGFIHKKCFSEYSKILSLLKQLKKRKAE